MDKINKIQFNTANNTTIVALFLLFLLSLNTAWAEQNSSEGESEKTDTTQKNDTSTSSETSAQDNRPSNPRKKVSPIKAPIALTKQHNEDLKHYLSSEQVKPLLAGPDDYITLFKKNTSINSKGVVILIPEWQQGATNPKAINFLRKTLPIHGWNTISIQPNNKPNNFPSEALTIIEQKKENDVILEEYKRKLGTMFNAVMNTAKKYPGIVLVIAQGNNGALLIDRLSQDDSQQTNAIIILSR